jgi:hypothetical protein
VVSYHLTAITCQLNRAVYKSTIVVSQLVTDNCQMITDH